MGQSVCKCCNCTSSQDAKHRTSKIYPQRPLSVDCVWTQGSSLPSSIHRRAYISSDSDFHSMETSMGEDDTYIKKNQNDASSEIITELFSGSTFAGDSTDELPTFLKRLKDITVRIGTNSRMLVELECRSDFKVTWYRNDNQILANDEYKIINEGNIYAIEFTCVSVQDNGHWTCSAESRKGRVTSSCYLQVIVPKSYKKPVFYEELEAVLTDEGTVSLQCKVVGVPTPLLRWFKDGSEIRAGDIFALVANSRDPISLGTYTCEASNCMGKVYSSSGVKVNSKSSLSPNVQEVYNVPPSGQTPIFIQELKNEKNKIGESFILSCNLAVPPWPKAIKWQNPQEQYIDTNNPRYKDLADGLGGYMLEIISSEECDKGTWKCIAVSQDNSTAVSSCDIQLTIPKNYRKPYFVEKLKAVLTEDGLVSFECKVVGYPTPHLRWFKDGSELKAGDIYQLTGVSSLGSYLCIAKNCMGEARSEAELTIDDIKQQLSHEETILLSAIRQPPKFLKKLTSSESSINSPFKFTVQVQMPPNPKLSWYRDDHRLEIDGKKYSQSNETLGVFHLNVLKLEFEDQAEWKCVASNEFGRTECSSFLKLIIPKHFKKPKFLENLRAVLTENGIVNLECKVIGVPQPTLKWFKDGVELNPGDIHKIMSGQDGTCCLGLYTCEAHNCMGSVTSSASIHGFEDATPTKPKIRKLSLSTINEEDTFRTADDEQSLPIDQPHELSYSFDGKEISVSYYDTPDLTQEEAIQIIEMYADQLSEHISEHNVLELPPLRIVKETSTASNILMEGVVIDIVPEYFSVIEDDLRTEAGIEDISVIEDALFSSQSSGRLRLNSDSRKSTDDKNYEMRSISDSIQSPDLYYSLSESKKDEFSLPVSPISRMSVEPDTETYISATSNQLDKRSSIKNTKIYLQDSPDRPQSTAGQSHTSEETGDIPDDDSILRHNFQFLTVLLSNNLTDIQQRLCYIEREMFLNSLKRQPDITESNFKDIGGLIQSIQGLRTFFLSFKQKKNGDFPYTFVDLNHIAEELQRNIDVIHTSVINNPDLLVQKNSIKIVYQIGETLVNVLDLISDVIKLDTFELCKSNVTQTEKQKLINMVLDTRDELNELVIVTHDLFIDTQENITVDDLDTKKTVDTVDEIVLKLDTDEVITEQSYKTSNVEKESFEEQPTKTVSSVTKEELETLQSEAHKLISKEETKEEKRIIEKQLVEIEIGIGKKKEQIIEEMFSQQEEKINDTLFDIELVKPLFETITELRSPEISLTEIFENKTVKNLLVNILNVERDIIQNQLKEIRLMELDENDMNKISEFENNKTILKSKLGKITDTQTTLAKDSLPQKDITSRDLIRNVMSLEWLKQKETELQDYLISINERRETLNEDFNKKLIQQTLKSQETSIKEQSNETIGLKLTEHRIAPKQLIENVTGNELLFLDNLIELSELQNHYSTITEEHLCHLAEDLRNNIDDESYEDILKIKQTNLQEQLNESKLKQFIINIPINEQIEIQGKINELQNEILNIKTKEVALNLVRNLKNYSSQSTDDICKTIIWELPQILEQKKQNINLQLESNTDNFMNKLQLDFKEIEELKTNLESQSKETNSAFINQLQMLCQHQNFNELDAEERKLTTKLNKINTDKKSLESSNQPSSQQKNKLIEEENVIQQDIYNIKILKAIQKELETFSTENKNHLLDPSQILDEKQKHVINYIKMVKQILNQKILNLNELKSYTNFLTEENIKEIIEDVSRNYTSPSFETQLHNAELELDSQANEIKSHILLLESSLEKSIKESFDVEGSMTNQNEKKLNHLQEEYKHIITKLMNTQISKLAFEKLKADPMIAVSRSSLNVSLPIINLIEEKQNGLKFQLDEINTLKGVSTTSGVLSQQIDLTNDEKLIILRKLQIHFANISEIEKSNFLNEVSTNYNNEKFSAQLNWEIEKLTTDINEINMQKVSIINASKSASNLSEQTTDQTNIFKMLESHEKTLENKLLYAKLKQLAIAKLCELQGGQTDITEEFKNIETIIPSILQEQEILIKSEIDNSHTVLELSTSLQKLPEVPERVQSNEHLSDIDKLNTELSLQITQQDPINIELNDLIEKHNNLNKLREHFSSVITNEIAEIVEDLVSNYKDKGNSYAEILESEEMHLKDEINDLKLQKYNVELLSNDLVQHAVATDNTVETVNVLDEKISQHEAKLLTSQIKNVVFAKITKTDNPYEKLEDLFEDALLSMPNIFEEEEKLLQLAEETTRQLLNSNTIKKEKENLINEKDMQKVQQIIENPVLHNETLKLEIGTDEIQQKLENIYKLKKYFTTVIVNEIPEIIKELISNVKDMNYATELESEEVQLKGKINYLSKWQKYNLEKLSNIPLEEVDDIAQKENILEKVNTLQQEIILNEGKLFNTQVKIMALAQVVETVNKSDHLEDLFQDALLSIPNVLEEEEKLIQVPSEIITTSANVSSIKLQELNLTRKLSLSPEKQTREEELEDTNETVTKFKEHVANIKDNEITEMVKELTLNFKNKNYTKQLKSEENQLQNIIKDLKWQRYNLERLTTSSDKVESIEDKDILETAKTLEQEISQNEAKLLNTQIKIMALAKVTEINDPTENLEGLFEDTVINQLVEFHNQEELIQHTSNAPTIVDLVTSLDTTLSTTAKVLNTQDRNKEFIADSSGIALPEIEELCKDTLQEGLEIVIAPSDTVLSVTEELVKGSLQEENTEIIIGLPDTVLSVTEELLKHSPQEESTEMVINSSDTVLSVTEELLKDSLQEENSKIENLKIKKLEDTREIDMDKLQNIAKLKEHFATVTKNEITEIVEELTSEAKDSSYAQKLDTEEEKLKCLITDLQWQQSYLVRLSRIPSEEFDDVSEKGDILQKVKGLEKDISSNEVKLLNNQIKKLAIDKVTTISDSCESLKNLFEDIILSIPNILQEDENLIKNNSETLSKSLDLPQTSEAENVHKIIESKSTAKLSDSDEVQTQSSIEKRKSDDSNSNVQQQCVDEKTVNDDSFETIRKLKEHYATVVKNELTETVKELTLNTADKNYAKQLDNDEARLKAKINDLKWQRYNLEKSSNVFLEKEDNIKENESTLEKVHILEEEIFFNEVNLLNIQVKKLALAKVSEIKCKPEILEDLYEDALLSFPEILLEQEKDVENMSQISIKPIEICEPKEFNEAQIDNDEKEKTIPHTSVNEPETEKLDLQELIEVKKEQKLQNISQLKNYFATITNTELSEITEELICQAKDNTYAKQLESEEVQLKAKINNLKLQRHNQEQLSNITFDQLNNITETKNVSMEEANLLEQEISLNEVKLFNNEIKKIAFAEVKNIDDQSENIEELFEDALLRMPNILEEKEKLLSQTIVPSIELAQPIQKKQIEEVGSTIQGNLETINQKAEDKQVKEAEMHRNEEPNEKTMNLEAELQTTESIQQQIDNEEPDNEDFDNLITSSKLKEHYANITKNEITEIAKELTLNVTDNNYRTQLDNNEVKLKAKLNDLKWQRYNLERLSNIAIEQVDNIPDNETILEKLHILVQEISLNENNLLNIQIKKLALAKVSEILEQSEITEDLFEDCLLSMPSMLQEEETQFQLATKSITATSEILQGQNELADDLKPIQHDSTLSSFKENDDTQIEQKLESINKLKEYLTSVTQNEVIEIVEELKTNSQNINYANQLETDELQFTASINDLKLQKCNLEQESNIVFEKTDNIDQLEELHLEKANILEHQISENQIKLFNTQVKKIALAKVSEVADISENIEGLIEDVVLSIPAILQEEEYMIQNAIRVEDNKIIKNAPLINEPVGLKQDLIVSVPQIKAIDLEKNITPEEIQKLKLHYATLSSARLAEFIKEWRTDNDEVVYANRLISEEVQLIDSINEIKTHKVLLESISNSSLNESVNSEDLEYNRNLEQISILEQEESLLECRLLDNHIKKIVITDVCSEYNEVDKLELFESILLNMLNILNGKENLISKNDDNFENDQLKVKNIADKLIDEKTEENFEKIPINKVIEKIEETVVDEINISQKVEKNHKEPIADDKLKDEQLPDILMDASKELKLEDKLVESDIIKTQEILTETTYIAAEETNDEKVTDERSTDTLDEKKIQQNLENVVIKNNAVEGQEKPTPSETLNNEKETDEIPTDARIIENKETKKRKTSTETTDIVAEDTKDDRLKEEKLVDILDDKKVQKKIEEVVEENKVTEEQIKPTSDDKLIEEKLSRTIDDENKEQRPDDKLVEKTARKKQKTPTETTDIETKNTKDDNLKEEKLDEKKGQQKIEEVVVGNKVTEEQIKPASDDKLIEEKLGRTIDDENKEQRPDDKLVEKTARKKQKTPTETTDIETKNTKDDNLKEEKLDEKKGQQKIEEVVVGNKVTEEQIKPASDDKLIEEKLGCTIDDENKEQRPDDKLIKKKATKKPETPTETTDIKAKNSKDDNLKEEKHDDKNGLQKIEDVVVENKVMEGQEKSTSDDKLIEEKLGRTIDDENKQHQVDDKLIKKKATKKPETPAETTDIEAKNIIDDNLKEEKLIDTLDDKTGEQKIEDVVVENKVTEEQIKPASDDKLIEEKLDRTIDDENKEKQDNKLIEKKATRKQETSTESTDTVVDVSKDDNLKEEKPDDTLDVKTRQRKIKDVVVENKVAEEQIKPASDDKLIEEKQGRTIDDENKEHQVDDKLVEKKATKKQKTPAETIDIEAKNIKDDNLKEEKIDDTLDHIKGQQKIEDVVVEKKVTEEQIKPALDEKLIDKELGRTIDDENKEQLNDKLIKKKATKKQGTPTESTDIVAEDIKDDSLKKEKPADTLDERKVQQKMEDMVVENKVTESQEKSILDDKLIEENLSRTVADKNNEQKIEDKLFENTAIKKQETPSETIIIAAEDTKTEKLEENNAGILKTVQEKIENTVPENKDGQGQTTTGPNDKLNDEQIANIIVDEKKEQLDDKLVENKVTSKQEIPTETSNIVAKDIIHDKEEISTNTFNDKKIQLNVDDTVIENNEAKEQENRASVDIVDKTKVQKLDENKPTKNDEKDDKLNKEQTADTLDNEKLEQKIEVVIENKTTEGQKKSVPGDKLEDKTLTHIVADENKKQKIDDKLVESKLTKQQETSTEITNTAVQDTKNDKFEKITADTLVESKEGQGQETSTPNNKLSDEKVADVLTGEEKEQLVEKKATTKQETITTNIVAEDTKHDKSKEKTPADTLDDRKVNQKTEDVVVDNKVTEEQNKLASDDKLIEEKLSRTIDDENKEQRPDDKLVEKTARKKQKTPTETTNIVAENTKDDNLKVGKPADIIDDKKVEQKIEELVVKTKTTEGQKKPASDDKLIEEKLVRTVEDQNKEEQNNKLVEKKATRKQETPTETSDIVVEVSRDNNLKEKPAETLDDKKGQQKIEDVVVDNKVTEEQIKPASNDKLIEEKLANIPLDELKDSISAKKLDSLKNEKIVDKSVELKVEKVQKISTEATNVESVKEDEKLIGDKCIQTDAKKEQTVEFKPMEENNIEVSTNKTNIETATIDDQLKSDITKTEKLKKEKNNNKLEDIKLENQKLEDKVIEKRVKKKQEIPPEPTTISPEEIKDGKLDSKELAKKLHEETKDEKTKAKLNKKTLQVEQKTSAKTLNEKDDKIKESEFTKNVDDKIKSIDAESSEPKENEEGIVIENKVGTIQQNSVKDKNLDAKKCIDKLNDEENEHRDKDKPVEKKAINKTEISAEATNIESEETKTDKHVNKKSVKTLESKKEEKIQELSTKVAAEMEQQTNIEMVLTQLDSKSEEQKVEDTLIEDKTKKRQEKPCAGDKKEDNKIEEHQFENKPIEKLPENTIEIPAKEVHIDSEETKDNNLRDEKLVDNLEGKTKQQNVQIKQETVSEKTNSAQEIKDDKLIRTRTKTLSDEKKDEKPEDKTNKKKADINQKIPTAEINTELENTKDNKLKDEKSINKCESKMEQSNVENELVENKEKKEEETLVEDVTLNGRKVNGKKNKNALVENKDKEEQETLLEDATLKDKNIIDKLDNQEKEQIDERKLKEKQVVEEIEKTSKTTKKESEETEDGKLKREKLSKKREAEEIKVDKLSTKKLSDEKTPEVEQKIRVEPEVANDDKLRDEKIIEINDGKIIEQNVENVDSKAENKLEKSTVDKLNGKKSGDEIKKQKVEDKLVETKVDIEIKVDMNQTNIVLEKKIDDKIQSEQSDQKLNDKKNENNTENQSVENKTQETQQISAEIIKPTQNDETKEQGVKKIVRKKKGEVQEKAVESTKIESKKVKADKLQNKKPDAEIQEKLAEENNKLKEAVKNKFDQKLKDKLRDEVNEQQIEKQKEVAEETIKNEETRKDNDHNLIEQLSDEKMGSKSKKETRHDKLETEKLDDTIAKKLLTGETKKEKVNKNHSIEKVDRNKTIETSKKLEIAIKSKSSAYDTDVDVNTNKTLGAIPKRMEHLRDVSRSKVQTSSNDNILNTSKIRGTGVSLDNSQTSVSVHHYNRYDNLIHENDISRTLKNADELKKGYKAIISDYQIGTERLKQEKHLLSSLSDFTKPIPPIPSTTLTKTYVEPSHTIHQKPRSSYISNTFSYEKSDNFQQALRDTRKTHDRIRNLVNLSESVTNSLISTNTTTYNDYEKTANKYRTTISNTTHLYKYRPSINLDYYRGYNRISQIERTMDFKPYYEHYFKLPMMYAVYKSNIERSYLYPRRYEITLYYGFLRRQETTVRGYNRYRYAYNLPKVIQHEANESFNLSAIKFNCYENCHSYGDCPHRYSNNSLINTTKGKLVLGQRGYMEVCPLKSQYRSVKWRSPDSEKYLKGNPETDTITTRTHSSLVFVSVKPKTVTNADHGISKSKTLVLDANSSKHSNYYPRVLKSSAMFITQPDSLISVAPGQDITVSFEINKDSNATVNWTKRSVDVTKNPRFRCEKSGTVTKYILKNSNFDDMGTYCLSAENNYGTSKTFVTVTVDNNSIYKNTTYYKLLKKQNLPVIGSIRVMPTHSKIQDMQYSLSSYKPSGGCTSYSLSPPLFYTLPHNAVVEIGEAARFQVTVGGFPSPTVTWKKDGIVIGCNSRIRIIEKFNTKMLEVVYTTAEDAGIYTITIQNEAGRTSATARLDLITMKKKQYNLSKKY